jgi:hypothetical protein
MPICEVDPWRMQYFERVACPDDVKISTEDADSWTWYPRHRWVYDKVAVALSQGLEAAPHGVEPKAFPVFSKPITNLKGMGVGSRVLATAADYVTHYAPGHMWMTLLEGRHVSSDVAVLDGKPVVAHATGHPGPRARPILDRTPNRCRDRGAPGAWIAQNLAGYTGMLNSKPSRRAIEVHLRSADQWPDLRGLSRRWCGSTARPLTIPTDRRDGYSVVPFGPHGRAIATGRRAGRRGARDAAVSSVQITFTDRPPTSTPCRRAASGSRS